MKRVIFIVIAMLWALQSLALYRVKLLDHKELYLYPEAVVQLPGYGVAAVCGKDSLMLLDNTEYASIRWVEPNKARSIVGCGNSFYAAEGDSIYRIATLSFPRKFIGRLDNEQFTLSTASDSTFYAVTADEDFSCVYEINPSRGVCTPVISIEAAILKIVMVDGKLMLWVDDTIMLADNNGVIHAVYSSPSITDMVVSSFGLIIGTDKSVLWMPSTGECVELISSGVTNLWWDDNDDLLYYRTLEGDIIVVVGLHDYYMNEIQK